MWHRLKPWSSWCPRVSQGQAVTRGTDGDRGHCHVWWHSLYLPQHDSNIRAVNIYLQANPRLIPRWSLWQWYKSSWTLYLATALETWWQMYSVTHWQWNMLKVIFPSRNIPLLIVCKVSFSLQELSTYNNSHLVQSHRSRFFPSKASVPDSSTLQCESLPSNVDMTTALGIWEPSSRLHSPPTSLIKVYIQIGCRTYTADPLCYWSEWVTMPTCHPGHHATEQ